MSIFGEGLIERLHQDTILRDPSNPMRKILDDGVGEWLDRFDDEYLGEMVFLESATGKWLDLHGKEYNVPRRLNESDDDYRERIVYEALEHLTSDYLVSVYGVKLYSFVPLFDARDNTLVSDNPYLCISGLMGEASDDSLISILGKKFILDNEIYWLKNGAIDYILDGNDNNLLNSYFEVYSKAKLRSFFKDNTNIASVRLTLPKANDCLYFLNNCTSLETVKLDLPNVKVVTSILQGCTNLTSATINMPKITSHTNFLGTGTSKTSNLEYLNINVPSGKVNSIKTYITGLSLSNLETLIINGEEVTL